MTKTILEMTKEVIEIKSFDDILLLKERLELFEDWIVNYTLLSGNNVFIETRKKRFDEKISIKIDIADTDDIRMFLKLTIEADNDVLLTLVTKDYNINIKDIREVNFEKYSKYFEGIKIKFEV